MILQNLFLGSVIFLRQDMIEHDQFFIFIYVNSLFTWILECGLALDQGLLKDCLSKGAQ